MKKQSLKFFDIAANLCDGQFFGKYHSHKCHQPDHDVVVERANSFGVDKFLFSSGCLKDVKKSYSLCQQFPSSYTTIGIHPCRARDLFTNDRESYLQSMEDLFEKFKDKVVAVGECGLDYDRFHFASKEEQMEAFPLHFEWSEKYKLPLYLHSRNCKDDFLEIVKKNRDKFKEGVVHSYTGCQDELKELLELDLYIGVNGCSLKTEENLEVVRKIPLERIVLETDSPYCEIRNTHACRKFLKERIFKDKDRKKYSKDFLVRGRNEPCKILEVCEVVSQLKEVSMEELSEAAYENSLKIFNIKD